MEVLTILKKISFLGSKTAKLVLFYLLIRRKTFSQNLRTYFLQYIFFSIFCLFYYLSLFFLFRGIFLLDIRAFFYGFWVFFLANLGNDMMSNLFLQDDESLTLTAGDDSVMTVALIDPLASQDSVDVVVEEVYYKAVSPFPKWVILIIL